MAAANRVFRGSGERFALCQTNRESRERNAVPYWQHEWDKSAAR